jgi:hypothetical protein
MEILVRRKHNLIDDDTWVMLQALETHIDDFMQNGKYPGIELMATGTSEFSATQKTFTKEFVAAMYARILSNSLTLITPTFDPLGIMIDPLLCHANHSCDPNAYIIMDGPQVQLRTLRDVKKDEEVFISYIDTTNPFARRQSELQERWFFTCECSKCQQGIHTQEDEWSIPTKDLPQNADDIVNEVFKSYEEQRQSDPSATMTTIESAMQLCNQSGFWPIHRQPYPALRDDLIVNLLAAAQYETAWAHCAKRHRYTAKLYPQPHHPIRVVQTWQMAMLAQYLASMGTQIKPGVDMAVVAAALVKVVSVAVEKSHGLDSTFAVSVRGKLEEVEGEMLARVGSKGDVEEAVRVQERKLMEMGDLSEY